MSAAPDFRVSASLFDHPKWMRLDALLSDKGGMALIRLWAWARTHRDDGSLAGLSDKEIASAARWRAPAAKLIDALVAAGFLDGPHGARSLHGWLEHQAHSANGKGYRRAQRLKGLQRWAKAAGMTAEAYCRYSFGITLDAYLDSDNAARTDAGASVRHMPGQCRDDAEPMPPPHHTSSHHTTPSVGMPPAPVSDPPDSPTERGFATTPDSPRLDAASLAHDLELRIGCSYAKADKAVRVVLAAGAEPSWVHARIAATRPPATPWGWQDEACRAIQPAAPVTTFFAPAAPTEPA